MGASGPNRRLFDVNIEGGTLELNNYNITADAGGVGTAIVKEFTVNVTDGTLNIAFDASSSVGGVDKPCVSAIEVIRAS